MNWTRSPLALIASGMILHSALGLAGPTPDDVFTAPVHGITSLRHPNTWEQSILTGNGVMGAMVPGNPCDETLYLSHASLYLPQPNSERYINAASHLSEIRELCLKGNYAAAGRMTDTIHRENSYYDQRDPFLAAFVLHIRQPQSSIQRYQRSVDYMTAETRVSVTDANGTFARSTFISRPDNVIVLRLNGTNTKGQSAEFSFEQLPVGEKQKAMVAASIKSSEQGVRNGLLYFRTLFANQNPNNPNIGYEGFGRVIARGGTQTATATGIQVTDAQEILVLTRIVPLTKASGVTSNAAAAEQELDSLPADYAALLSRHAKVHGELMDRVRFSLEAPAADRTKPTEQLIDDSQKLDAPLAQIERAFEAGRYNIICSTGLNPPNLQGLWSGTWQAPWCGSFTTDGNLPCAVSFQLMGNTPELMHSFFAYYDRMMPGFRENAKLWFGARGFHVPAQLTINPRETDFSPAYPLCYWHAGAAWACQSFYDYYRYTGDEKFLAERAYPMMKEAAAFYEDFLTVTDPNGKLVFVPSYSPENAPLKTRTSASINATMDIAAARQLLRNTIAAAKHLNRDTELQTKWAGILAKLPNYEVGPDGSFREWLWPGLVDNNEHRHASHLYALYDECPAEIVNSPELVKAVEHTIRQRLDFQERSQQMAFGIVQLGLAAEHIGNPELAQEAINFLAKGYWSTGMASFHNRGNLFNMDISGGFPYLCASALVYADPGKIRFFPARPAQWTKGSVQGLRLRGGITLRELTWDGDKAKAILVSDTNQTVTITCPHITSMSRELHAGVAAELDL